MSAGLVAMGSDAGAAACAQMSSQTEHAQVSYTQEYIYAEMTGQRVAGHVSSVVLSRSSTAISKVWQKCGVDDSSSYIAYRAATMQMKLMFLKTIFF